MTRELLVDSSPEEHRVVVLEDGRPAEILIERSGERLLGNVYLGKVDKVVPGMQAAFVDVGLERHAFLHASDLAIPGPKRGAGDRAIEDLVQSGQVLPVQVTREPLGGKGARITAQLTLAGRFLVLVPQDPHVGISRRLQDGEVRDRLRALVEELRGDSGWGCIVRTAAAAQGLDVLRAELEELMGEWALLEAAIEAEGAPALLRSERPLPLRVVRDLLSSDVKRIVVGDADLHDLMRAELELRAPAMAEVLELHGGGPDVLADLGLEKEIEKALRPKVWLRSGGYLVINQLEALVAIDVNTGKFTGGKRLEETALKVNIEAAREVARQLRLRDLGGIVVVDFIDMEEPENRRKVFDVFEQALAGDRAKTTVLGMSDFCLVQVTRQRQRKSLERELSEPCPYCSGTGRIRAVETTVAQILRRVRALGRDGVRGPVRATVHPDVAAALRERLEALEQEGGYLHPRLEVCEDPTKHRETLELSASPSG
jgi:ribonuclease G